MSALIVSDIDGTLIDSRERIPSAVKESLAAAQRAGVSFVVATGRPARWIHPIIDQLYTPPTLCVCANGAVIYDPACDRITRRREMAPDAMRTVVRVAREALSDLGGCGVGVERAGVSAHDMPGELFMVTPDFVHSWESIEHSTVELDRVLARPAVKLLLRNDALISEQMHRLVAPVVPADVAHVTYSMPDGLLEVMQPGVNKSSALDVVAQDLGVDPADAIAFGDMLNDLEMIRWAGTGVAMGNACDQLQRAADVVAPTNDQAGIAVVLREWLQG